MKPAIPALVKAVRAVDVVVSIAVALSLLMVLAFTVGQVVDRYWLKSTFDGHDQYARVGLVWLTFLGIALGIRERINIRIELLAHFGAPGIRRTVSVVLDVVMLVVAIVVVVVGLPLLEVGGYQSIMGTALSRDVMYAAVLVGMGLLILFLILRLADRLSGQRLQVDLPEPSDDHRA